MRRPSAQSRGLTLIEILTAVAISAILLATAAPSFLETIARMRMEGAVNGLSIDLQYARTEAVRRRTSATLTVAGGGASYDLTYLVPGTATQSNFRSVSLPSGMALTASGDLTFDPLRGTASAQTYLLTSSSTSAQLRVQTTAIGRIQVCSPLGSFKGYNPC